MTLDAIIRETQTLSTEERKQLIKFLVDTLSGPTDAEKKHSLRELSGLGKDIWEGIDAQDYINQLRDEWDARP